ncbi:NAC domain-containing protein 92 [Lactuca sativa]|uniref:NAC domain-containing protein n=1 Tax=Lactuca sativa TaxID=4236 RepID=A0A9R1XU61_LACSA|nr:NAC domain-containing protein 92 [Lactuca sativa]KAJ0219407.1 hypothetical protein LSAT_V11C300138500 [Lactuca sativa]
MEDNYGSHDHEEHMELPPGFRFHPTDDELIIHYLYRKVFDDSFASRAIGDVDLNKFEPWELPLRAKIGEKEWYFFCVRDRKYPTGLRSNRATEMGYWKATGKDREIYKAKTLVGMKKTLVFYKGRAPKGEKTNWIMHEFRLEGRLKNLSASSKGEWVISKVFEKNCGGKKIQISGVSGINYNSYEDELEPSNLPPLMDVSRTVSESIEEQKPTKEELIETYNKSISMMPSMNDNLFGVSNNQMVPNIEYLQYHDPSILMLLIDKDDHSSMQQNSKSEFGNNQDYAMNLAGLVDLDWVWNY